MPTPAQMRKGIVAAVALVLQLIALGVIPEDVQPYVSAVIAALTAIGVYVVPNEQPAPAAYPGSYSDETL